MQVEHQIVRKLGIYGTVDHGGRRFVVWQLGAAAEPTVVGQIHPTWDRARTVEAVVQAHETKARAIAAERGVDAELPHFIAYVGRLADGVSGAMEVDRREGQGAFQGRLRAGIAAAMMETDPFRRAVAFERVVQIPCDVGIVAMMQREGLDVSASVAAHAQESAKAIERRLSATATAIEGDFGVRALAPAA